MSYSSDDEERFRIACDAARIMVYEIDAVRGRAKFIHGLEALLGYELEKELHGEGWWFSRIHHEDLPSVLEQLRYSRIRGKDYSIQYRVRHKNGEYIVVEDSGRSIMDQRGRLLRSVGSVVNITQRKQAADALRQSEQRYHEFAAELERMVEQRTAQLRNLAAELTHAEERERKRLAQSIHDDLQQLLVGAKFCADTLAGAVQTEALKETARQLNAMLKEAIESARSLTVELSPPILHEIGLVKAIQHLARRMESKHGLTVGVRSDERAEPLPEEIRILLFQCTRELLFNVVKHAHVKAAEVEVLRSEAGEVQVTVSDAGTGFGPGRIEEKSSEGGFGLFSIRGRLGLTGGRLEIESAPGAGTRCTIIVPDALIRLRGNPPGE